MSTDYIILIIVGLLLLVNIVYVSLTYLTVL